MSSDRLTPISYAVLVLVETEAIFALHVLEYDGVMDEQRMTSGDDGLIFKWDASGKLVDEVRLRGSTWYGPLSKYGLGQVLLTPDGKTAVMPTIQTRAIRTSWVTFVPGGLNGP